MKIQKKQAGFTLIELITVVSMLALLTIFVAREMGQSSDDIKKNLVVTALVSSFPAAIASFKGANFGNCVASGTDITLTDLAARGVPLNSPWGVAWTFSYAPLTRDITITYSVSGANDAIGMVTSLVSILANNAAFEGEPAVGTDTTTIVVVYSC